MPVIDSIIAKYAKDEIPETWAALADYKHFGEEALARRLISTVSKVFGTFLTNDQQNELNLKVVEYTAKVFVISLIRPGVDYWSKQVIDLSAGERERKAYSDRAKELKDMRGPLLAEISELYLEIQPLLPLLPKRASDSPKVSQIGDNIQHLTANPYDLDPLSGPAEDIASSTA